MTSNKKIVAVNVRTGSKYIRCDCKKGVCKVQTNGAHSYWTIDKKQVKVL